MSTRRLCWGLVSRRERLGLSRWGWLLLALLAAGVFFFLLGNIRPFLVQTAPVKSDVIVLEGWVQEYAARAVAREFMNGSCQKIYTTGGPITGVAGDTNVFNTEAGVGAALLERVGLPAAFIQAVPAPEVGRDRTYTSAVALREWFQARGMTVHSLNVYTEDAHARRTRLLFQEAFGPDVAVGVVAIPNPDYDPVHWWRYSEGVREVVGETIAYLYARLVFQPGKTPSQPGFAATHDAAPGTNSR